MREGKRVVSLQAANEEVMYYYTPISYNQPLLWLFHTGLVWLCVLFCSPYHFVFEDKNETSLYQLSQPQY